jgi:hypothetical protein
MRLGLSVVLGIVLLAGVANADTVERTVKANSSTAVGGFFGYEVNTCYPSGIPDVKIHQQAGNGTVEIRPHQAKLNKDARCPGLAVNGLAYVYTPKKGFKGMDEFSVDVPWSTNTHSLPSVYTHTYRINVQ